MLLTSPRLALRHHTLADFEAVLTFTRDPEAARHSSWGPLDEIQTREWLTEAMQGDTQWAITLRSTGELIGNASLKRSVPEEAEIGYTFSSTHWGKGYATEIAQALARHAFATLKLHRLIATTSPLNLASQRVLEKAGFTREGYLRKATRQRGQWRDSLLYARLEDDAEPTS